MRRLWLGAALAGLLSLACSPLSGGKGEEPTGVVAVSTAEAAAAAASGDRIYEMGLSSLPAENTIEGLEDAFQRADAGGELVLIRTFPDWGSFLEGASLSDALVNRTRADLALVEKYGLDVFVAIDPTDPTDRSRLVRPPEELRGLSFADPAVQNAYLGFVRYMAANYKPKYMALAVEVNMIYEKSPDAFQAFVALYSQAYDTVKEISPGTALFVTFQYEDLLGLFPFAPHDPRWELLQPLEPKLDLLAFSTYPSFVFDSAAEIPADYYQQLRTRTDKPLAVAEAGFASGPGIDGVNEGTEEDQRLFLQRLLAEADTLPLSFLVWFEGQDPVYATEAPFAYFQYMGLLRQDGMEKPAWSTWLLAAQRPYVGAGTAADSPDQPP